MTKIIVTNDDGVNAPGILALATALRTIGEVEIIAPGTNQSASGHKKTLFQDMKVEHPILADGTEATAIYGSPADCIALAALGIAAWPPHIVVSGINRGSNMGQDITYSGTVTAALESVIHGAPAIAVSLDDTEANTVESYQEAARVAVEVAKHVLIKGLPPYTILNVNVPQRERVKGLRFTRQGLRIYRDQLERIEDVCRIIGPAPTGQFEEEGTDLWAVHQGYVSITPIHLDMTAHRFVADLVAWNIEL